MKPAPLILAILFVIASIGPRIESAPTKGSHVVPITGPPKACKDGRPAAAYRLDAVDQGRVLLHGDGPGGTSVSHMKRDIGLAWLNLPLIPPPGK